MWHRSTAAMTNRRANDIPQVTAHLRLIDDVRGRKRNMRRAAHSGNQHTNYSCKYAVRHRASSHLIDGTRLVTSMYVQPKVDQRNRSSLKSRA